MRRWHEELPLMLGRWRADQRRHRIPSAKGPGMYRKRRPHDCGRTRCYLCHEDKLSGARPVREAARRGRLNARLEGLRWERVASGDVW